MATKSAREDLKRGHDQSVPEPDPHPHRGDPLWQDREKYRLMVDDMPALICRFKPDGTLTYVNDAYCKYFEKTRRELIGGNLFQFIPESEHAGIREHLKTLSRCDSVRTYEHQVVSPRGELRWQHWTDRAFFNSRGDIIEFQSIGYDTTDKKIAERALKESEARYRTLFEGASDAIFINDLGGRFLEINQVACDRLEYPRAALLKKTFKGLAAPEQIRILDAMGERIRKGETVQFEIEMLTSSGKPIPFEFHTCLITFAGGPAYLTIARNLAERKKMELALIRSERLSAIGEMASGVAHNFNNLLQMIMGAAEAALSKLDSGQIRACRDVVQTIVDTSKRGADIVSRIKDFIYMDVDDAAGHQLIDLGELLSEAVQLTKPLWQDYSKSRPYKVNYFKNVGCRIMGNPSEIYEVLVNLIRNALEAMPHGGSLTLYPDRQNDDVILRISDTGHGIRAEHLQRIFEPFFTTKGSKSSGLGLASSYGIIKKHGGEMRVKSIPTQGTTFTVILPAAKNLVAMEAEHSNDVNGFRFRLLLIDDEVNIAKMMEMYFEDTEVEVVSAHTAQQGLKLFRHDRFDGVLCDLGMDDMNGWEVARAVQSHCRENAIKKPPFFLFTGFDQPVQSEKLKHYGVDRIIKKPIAGDTLLAIIREVSV